MVNMYELCAMAAHSIYQADLVPPDSYVDYNIGEDWFRIYVFFKHGKKRQFTFRADTNSDVPVKQQVRYWVAKKFCTGRTTL